MDVIDQRRRLTRANHSSLHLLQAALIKVLGTHIAQSGSYVCPDYGRFDFTHFEKVTPEQIDAVEKQVNEWIDAELPVHTEVMDIESAKNSGAIALFDEKYGDTVRVVSMGDETIVSKEFCAGTHVDNTADLGCFAIISEESIGSGIRRMTVVTKTKAYEWFKSKATRLRQVQDALGSKSETDVLSRIDKLKNDLNDANHTIDAIQLQQRNALANDLASKATSDAIGQVVIGKVNVSSGALKPLASAVLAQLKDGYVALVCVDADKLGLVVAASKARIDAGYNAGAIVKHAAQIAQGNGGGKADLAQAGGKDIHAVDAVLADYQSHIQN